jgi:hypothetical protein
MHGREMGTCGTTATIAARRSVKGCSSVLCHRSRQAAAARSGTRPAGERLRRLPSRLVRMRGRCIPRRQSENEQVRPTRPSPTLNGSDRPAFIGYGDPSYARWRRYRLCGSVPRNTKAVPRRDLGTHRTDPLSVTDATMTASRSRRAGPNWEFRSRVLSSRRTPSYQRLRGW